MDGYDDIKLKVGSRLKKYTRQEKIVLPVFHIILLLFALYQLLPLVYLLLNSFKSVPAYYDNALALPKPFVWANLKRAFQLRYRNTTVLKMFVNSVWFVISFSFGNIFSSVLTAYVLARFKFRGRNLIYSLAIVVQIIPIFGTEGAAYLIMDRLGLVDNPALIWISAASGFDYTFLIVYSYFVSIDNSYSEAAEMDGAGLFTIFYKIMVPMVIPAILTMWLSAFINLWNDYTTALLYLPTHPTLATGLYNLKALAPFQEGGITTYFAAMLVAMIPVFIVFIATQKKIFKINMSGGIKG